MPGQPESPQGGITGQPESPQQPGAPDGDHPSTLRVTAWVGVAVTVALLTTGAIFGLAAQANSDEVSRRLHGGDTGTPTEFTAMEQQQYNDLCNTGKLYNGIGIGLMAASGATAITSAILFYLDHRAHGLAEQHVRIAPSLSPRGGGMAASFQF